MKMMAGSIMVVIVLMRAAQCTATTGASENSIVVEFDFAEPPDWSPAVVDAFKLQLANVTNQFCRSNLSTCGMNTFKEFTADGVEILPAYPKEQTGDSLLAFFVNLPQSTASQPDMSVINKPGLTQIVTRHREQIARGMQRSSSLADRAAFRISFIDGVQVLPRDDQTLNTIIIPTFCSVVLVMCLGVFALETQRKRQEKSRMGKVFDENKRRRDVEEVVALKQDDNGKLDVFQTQTDQPAV